MKIALKTRIFNLIRGIFLFPPLEKLLLKFTIEKEPSAFFTRLIPNNYQYKKHTYRVANRNGINYHLDISDWIDRWIYFGLQEKATTKLYSLIKKDFYVIDIGANVGGVTLNAARLIGEKGKVLSFEPDPLNFERLKKNISLNPFQNIRTINLGLGDEEGIFYLERIPGNTGMNKIIPNPIPSRNTIPVQVTTLDNYLEKNYFPKVDLIKIDVEGYEMKVLKGSINTLQKFHPTLFIEVDDENLKEQGTSAKELVNFIQQTGYRIIKSENDSPVTLTSDFSRCHYDILCTWQE